MSKSCQANRCAVVNFQHADAAAPITKAKAWTVDRGLCQAASMQPSSALEHGDHRIRHDLVTAVVEMQVVTAIESGIQPGRLGWVTQRRIEISDAIQARAISQPVVDGLPMGLTARREIIEQPSRSAGRRQGARVHLQAITSGAVTHLPGPYARRRYGSAASHIDLTATRAWRCRSCAVSPTGARSAHRAAALHRDRRPVDRSMIALPPARTPSSVRLGIMPMK